MLAERKQRSSSFEGRAMNDTPQIAIHLVYPTGTRIRDFQSYRPGYLAYPARLTVETPAGAISHCVLKQGECFETLAHEAQVLTALAELGLPVPQVLAGPMMLQDGKQILVLSELPGLPLPWLGVTNLADAQLTCRLMQQAVIKLHELTDQIKMHRIGSKLPSIALDEELDTIIERAGPWFENALFSEAVELLQRALPAITTPLVFSNGDYNPLNFLHLDQKLTGWLDFEHACFEDPYIGFAKFLLWSYDDFGWGTGGKIGLVERFLYAQNVTRAQFAPRVVLRCLRHLQEGVSVKSQEDARPRQHMLNILAEEIVNLNRSVASSSSALQ